MKVIISGGGIAGLATAGFLMQQGIQPVIIEKAKKWSRIGYGISLWGNGIKMMQALGLDDMLFKKGRKIESWTIRDNSNEVLHEAKLDFDNIPPLTAIHRADLHEILLSIVPDELIKMNNSIEQITDYGEKLKVKLTGGETMDADLLIGADGTHSRVNELIFKKPAKKTGTAVFSFWIPESLEVPEGFNEIYSDNGKAVLFAPVNERKMCSIAFPVGQADKKEFLPILKAKTTNDEHLLQELIKVIEKDEKVFKDHIYRVKLDQWVQNRIVMLGDAAHALHPIVGMGASLALEDAYVINQEILNYKYGDINKGLHSFSNRRQKRIKSFSRQAKLTAEFTFLENKTLTVLRNKLLKNSGFFEGFFMDNASRIARNVLSDI